MFMKAMWAFILGTIMYKLMPNNKYSWLVGAIIGGIAHTIGYTLVKIPLYGMALAMGELFTTGCQSAAGVILGGAAYMVLSKSPAIREICKKVA